MIMRSGYKTATGYQNINQEALGITEDHLPLYLHETPESKPINIQQAATQDIPQPRARTI
jgi:hypothetical protein